MVWVMLDDKFHGHSKTLALFDGPCPADAIALWTLGASWCGDQLTDGFLPTSFVKRSGFDKRAAAELVRVGLWEPAEGGYRFHDWLDRNKSKDQVERERGQKRTRQQRWRDNHPPRNASRNASTDATHNGSEDASVTAAPTRPDPDPEEEKTHAARASSPPARAQEEPIDGPEQPPHDAEPWLKAWAIYVETCCRGVAPGAAHTFQVECSSLWRAGAIASPSDPGAGARRYLLARVEQSRREGRTTPRLKYLVEDLPAWLETLAKPPARSTAAHTMSELTAEQAADRDRFMRETA